MEAARKKAERDRLLAEEESTQRSTPKGSHSKKAEKKTRGTLDLGQLDSGTANGDVSSQDVDGRGGGGGAAVPALSASNIDDALDALSLATGHADDLKVDRHPERRFRAAYRAFEERRLPEIEAENPGLRKQQRVEICRKEFERSPLNPFNQVGNVRHDASREEVEEVRRRAREGVETRLGEKR